MPAYGDYVYNGAFTTTINQAPTSTSSSRNHTTIPSEWVPTRTKPIAALTTPFSGPKTCFVDDNNILAFATATNPLFPDNKECFPESFTYYPYPTEDILHNYYSPAVCPKGYTIATKITSQIGMEEVFATSIGPKETWGICCPSAKKKKSGWEWQMSACWHVEAEKTTEAAPINIRWKAEDNLQWETESKKLSAGVIVGLVIGVIGVLLLLGGAVFYMRRRKRDVGRGGSAEKIVLVKPSADFETPPPPYVHNNRPEHVESFKGDELSSSSESAMVADGMRPDPNQFISSGASYTVADGMRPNNSGTASSARSWTESYGVGSDGDRSELDTSSTASWMVGDGIRGYQ